MMFKKKKKRIANKLAHVLYLSANCPSIDPRTHSEISDALFDIALEIGGIKLLNYTYLNCYCKEEEGAK